MDEKKGGNLILEHSTRVTLGLSKMMRMSRDQFHEILDKIDPLIAKLRRFDDLCHFEFPTLSVGHW